MNLGHLPPAGGTTDAPSPISAATTGAKAVAVFKIDSACGASDWLNSKAIGAKGVERKKWIENDRDI